MKSFNKVTFYLASFISFVFIAFPCYADFPYQGQWWINAGLGVADGKITNTSLPANIPDFAYKKEKDEATNLNGLAGEISLNLPTAENQLLTLRGINASNSDLLCLSGCSSFNEIGLLYGLMSKGEYGYVSASAGLSYVHAGYTGNTNSDYLGVKFDDKMRDTVGIPAEIQAFYTPFKYFGIGVVGFGNLNSVAPMVGAALELQFGKLFS